MGGQGHGEWMLGAHKMVGEGRSLHLDELNRDSMLEGRRQGGLPWECHVWYMVWYVVCFISHVCMCEISGVCVYVFIVMCVCGI